MAQLKKPGLDIPMNMNPGQLPGSMPGKGLGMQNLPDLGIPQGDPFGGRMPPGGFKPNFRPPPTTTPVWPPPGMTLPTAPTPPPQPPPVDDMASTIQKLLAALQPSQPGVMDWVKLGLGTLGPILAGLGGDDKSNGLTGIASSQNLTEDAVRKANEQYENLLARRNSRPPVKLRDSYVKRNRKPVKVDGVPFDIGGQ